MLNLRDKIKFKTTNLDGYISLFLPVFIVLLSIPVYAVLLSQMYFKAHVRATETAEIIAKSYYSAATWSYKVQYKACQNDPLECKSNNEMSDFSIEKAEEIKTELEEKYKVHVDVSHDPKELKLNENLKFEVRLTQALPSEISFIQKEIFVLYTIQTPLVDTAI